MPDQFANGNPHNDNTKDTKEQQTEQSWRHTVAIFKALLTI
jgi:hypothetical protein